MKKSIAGLLVYACQLLNDKSDFQGGEELMETTWSYHICTRSQTLKQFLDGWWAACGLLFVQTVQKHVEWNLVRCIGTTQCSMNQSNSHIVAGLNCGEGGLIGWLWIGKSAPSLGVIGDGMVKSTIEHARGRHGML